MTKSTIVAEWRKPQNNAVVTAERLHSDEYNGFTHKLKIVQIARFKSEKACMQHYRKCIRELGGEGDEMCDD